MFKQMRNFMKIALLPICLGVLVLGCKKYEEGGKMRDARETLTSHEWIQKNETFNPYIFPEKIVHYFNSDGTYKAYDSLADAIELTSTGDWVLSDDNTAIDLIKTDRMNSRELSTILGSDYNLDSLTDEQKRIYLEQKIILRGEIIRLDDSELKIDFTNTALSTVTEPTRVVYRKE